MYELNRNFNSIKVRLELADDYGLVLTLQFQFHKGTIRTKQTTKEICSGTKFQFHKGTIRTKVLDILHN